MKSTLSSRIKTAILSVFVGVLAGLTSALFLYTLDWVTEARLLNPNIIWGLPVIGLFIGWVYFRFGKDFAKGHNLILEEIHEPRKILPAHMAPFVLGGTLLTHLFGGSAGREGTAVQISASLADQLSRFFKISAEERKTLLTAGMSAGFGSVIGAPWAGAIFGLEVLHVDKFRIVSWLECLIASFVGYSVTNFLQAPHSQFQLIHFPDVGLQVFFWIFVAGICFGLAARFFTFSTHLVENFLARWISYPPLRPFVGGILLLFFYYIEGSYHYLGLGIAEIQNAFAQTSLFHEPLLKSFFTSLTVGSGFKGGEFIPLVYIGTTLGSALSIIIPLSAALLAGVGFVAVFAGAANTPIACTLLAMELFGPHIGVYALVACLTSYFTSGKMGIYKAQK